MSLPSSSSSSHIFDTIQHAFPKDIHVGKATRIVGETATQFLLKTTYQSSPFLVQTPNMHIKQKFQKVAGNKCWSTDLVFAVSDSEFYDWFETLEKFCVDYLFENQKQWFQTDLSTEDIEGLFVSPFRVFKSSKTYQMRCHISDLGQSLAIFGPDKKRVEYDEQYITDAPLLGIVEVVGIRCSQKHFQIDLELKQLLELPTGKDVESCLIRPRPLNSNPVSEPYIASHVTVPEPLETVPVTGSEPLETVSHSPVTYSDSPSVNNEDSKILETELENSVIQKDEMESVVLKESGIQEEVEGIDLEIEEIGSGEEGGFGNEIIDLSIIRKRVLEKARMAMDLGVINYLDRKNIGNTQLYLDFSKA